MKKILVFFAVLLLFFCIWGCENPEQSNNVTKYVFDNSGNGYDFENISGVTFFIDSISEEEVYESMWLVYLIYESNASGAYFSFPLPGTGLLGDSDYYSSQHYSSYNETIRFDITRTEGSGEVYSEIHVVRIVPSSISTQP